MLTCLQCVLRHRRFTSVLVHHHSRANAACQNSEEKLDVHDEAPTGRADEEVVILFTSRSSSNANLD